MVKQDAGLNTAHLRNHELKWTGMGGFNSADHDIYYCATP